MGISAANSSLNPFCVTVIALSYRQLLYQYYTIYPSNPEEPDFSGKKVAYFGCGDQVGYADNFLDAIGILEEKITERGGKTVGYWSTEGYEFDESKAVRNGKFVGLALDDTNQSDLTEQRLRKWVSLLKSEFGI